MEKENSNLLQKAIINKHLSDLALATASIT